MAKHVSLEEWIKSLEDKKYPQGTGTLRTFNDEYCCLGVLCELAGAEWTDHNGGEGYQAIISFDDEPILDNYGDLPQNAIEHDVVNKIIGEKIFDEADINLFIKSNDGDSGIEKRDFPGMAELIKETAKSKGYRVFGEIK